MSNKFINQGYAFYRDLFPKSSNGLTELVLQEKVGKASSGNYLFAEIYCTQKDCDCRRVILQVTNEKGKLAALINLPLVADMSPALIDTVKQSAASEVLLDVFIDVLGDDPDWFRGMCRRYRAVQKKNTGIAYQGAPFPKNFPFLFADEDDSFDIDDMLQRLENSVFSASGGQNKTQTDSRQRDLFAEESIDYEQPIVKELVDSYRMQGSDGFDNHRDRQRLMRGCLYRYGSTADELAVLLIDFYHDEDDEGIDAALRLLADVLETLRVDLERQRPGAVAKMQHWQQVLASQIFAVGVDFELGAEVTRVLLDSRVEILPQLHEANSQRMLSEPDHK
ncbi:MAG: hypothetical protein KAU27_02950, partial [Desulfuromonadales bacterium]|nr:hypothetical protein [Desulfuromonadales bacterium]